jgi:ferritin-like metal-binding protein YciE
MGSNTTVQSLNLGADKLRRFFVDHLNRIYCAKTHMLRRFREIAEHASYQDLYFAINETADDMENQISRMEQVYAIMNADQSETSCTGMTAMLDEALVAMYEDDKDPALRDMAILFYMQNIEGIEAASFQVLKIAAEKLGDKQVTQLIIENFDESKADRALLVELTSRYMSS